MEKVPQVVRERLKAGVPVSTHPDAEVLTAFAERSLPERERTSVLEHLARCHDCRDIVALALPETEAVQTVAIQARPRWMTWPAFRWGFAMAGVAIVALGVLQYQRRTQPTASMVAQRTSAPQPYPQSPPAAETVPAPAPSIAKQEADHSVVSAMSTKRASPLGLDREATMERPQAASPNPSGNARSAFGGPVRYGPSQPNLAQQQQQQQSPARVLPFAAAPAGKQQAGGVGYGRGGIPPASESVEVQSPALTVSTEAKITASGAAATAPSAPAQQLFDDLASPAVGKAKAPITVPGRRLAASANTPQPPPVPAAPSNPRWSISSTGSLQRSFDQGATWQDVNVSSAAAENFTAYSANQVVVLEKSRARQADADKKTALKAIAAPVFRAVTAAGSDVWAGGSNGALYHSVDAGDHWVRVVPVSAGATLSGDVVAMQFSDSQHGTVTTSNGGVWVTSDDGQTWQKQ